MDVLRHDDVSDHRKPVPAAHLFENLEEKISTSDPSEQSTATVATRSYEVLVSAAADAS